MIFKQPAKLYARHIAALYDYETYHFVFAWVEEWVIHRRTVLSTFIDKLEVS